ncbi:hypothetical protein V7S43_012110 [Phytophthora oleae]|uniref:Rieske domain-containing protein n=1 Tax=Phytophthora oleae TaxID=2107226 RepID=A0ABD3F752_9STRA
MRSTATIFLRGSGRVFSTASVGRRVLCSLKELQNLHGKGLKFPLHPPESKEAAPTADTKSTTRPRRRLDLLATGFVFFNEKTQQPRAFINRCPHAMLELDFDDSDFFCEGFIHCKAHAAFFDPDTGICLQGPISSRKALRVRGVDMKTADITNPLLSVDACGGMYRVWMISE